MDKKSRSVRPEDAGASSSSSGADTSRLRYKPLAPKRPSAPGTSVSPSEPEDEALPAADLTFVNFTDPLQSKSQESRKLVRTQVMRNFAREQKKQKARGEASGASGEGSGSTASTVSSVRPSMSDMGEGLRPRSSRGRLQSSVPERAPKIAVVPTSSGSNQLRWPVIMEAHDEELKRHCLSPSFGASNPLYMISLLARRPGAETYPLMVDIDATAEITGPAPVDQNPLYRLAENSASLAHAIMMVSASDLALRQVNKVTSDHLVIYHKSRALTLLNEAIRDVQSSGSLETLATAAVLACHELVVGDYKAWTVHILGFSRMIAINGGINFLDRENPVRQLILWSDQVGALFMNMRPLFPASAVFASSASLSQNVSPQVTTRYREEAFQSLLSWQRMQAEGCISEDLVAVMEDINLVAFTGAQAIVDETSYRISGLVDLRDQIIHRLLYLSPLSQDGDDEYSFEECARLAMLLVTLDRLFSPLLPGAYFHLTHMVADRLASVISGHQLEQDWAGHEWTALWICFVGASVSTNNPSTRGSFVGAAAPLCRSLFKGPEQMDHELEEGLRACARAPVLYGAEIVAAFVHDLKSEGSRIFIASFNRDFISAIVVPTLVHSFQQVWNSVSNAAHDIVAVGPEFSQPVKLTSPAPCAPQYQPAQRAIVQRAIVREGICRVESDVAVNWSQEETVRTPFELVSSALSVLDGSCSLSASEMWFGAGAVYRSARATCSMGMSGRRSFTLPLASEMYRSPGLRLCARFDDEGVEGLRRAVRVRLTPEEHGSIRAQRGPARTSIFARLRLVLPSSRRLEQLWE